VPEASAWNVHTKGTVPPFLRMFILKGLTGSCLIRLCSFLDWADCAFTNEKRQLTLALVVADVLFLDQRAAEWAHTVREKSGI